jgi:hypothetical protein
MYQPKHQPQLGRGIPVPGRTQGSRDCGPRSWSMGVDARSKGRRRPSVRWLRKRGNVEGPQPTSIDDAKRAVHGLAVRGRSPMRYWRTRSVAKVRQWVRKGRPVQLAIDYGTWNDLRDHETGDPRFRGGHSVMIYGQRKTVNLVEWQLFDPLEDGRRAGIVSGPSWVPRWQVVRAAKALGEQYGRRDIWAGLIGGAHGQR